MSTVLLVSGTCAENGNLLAGWAFTYDGDGSRARQVYTDGTSTLTTYYFAGGTYEVRDDGTTGTVWKYYAFAGMTVAVNDGSGLKYLLTDHLGSIVAVTNSSSALLSEQRYLPFGQVRTDAGSITETDFGYTGQRNLDAQGNVYSLGLMDYKARFYDAALMRFTQADSVTSVGTQGLNRYSYGLNNPSRYTDPTGHCIDEGDAPPESPANRNLCPKRKTFSLDQGSIDTCNPGPCYTTLETPNSWDTDPNNPDYYSFSINQGIWTVNFTLDRYNQIYVGFGVNKGKSYGFTSFSLTGGFIHSPFDTGINNGVDIPSQGNISSFLSGLTINASYGWVGGGGATISPSVVEYVPELYGFNDKYYDVRPYAIEVGAFLPPAKGVSAVYSVNVTDLWGRIYNYVSTHIR
jgi:RHS repeat-associated protein